MNDTYDVTDTSTEPVFLLEDSGAVFGRSYDDAVDLRADRTAKAGFEPCEHCGRKVVAGKAYIVTVVAGGGAIAKPGTADESDPGYMGGYVLGSTCAKSIPAEYREVWEG